MTYFPSLSEEGALADVFRRFPRGVEALLDFHDELLRGESELTVGERELIAAYVSALNDCGFCFQAHRVYSAMYGIDVELFDGLVDDIETSDLSEEMKPLFRYIRKLTLTPAKVVQEDVNDVLDAGYTEEAVHDAILVVGLFNLMNRILFGHGVDEHQAHYGRKLAQIQQVPLEQRRARNQTDLGATPYQDFGQNLRGGSDDGDAREER